ncbi:FMN-binding domain protein [Treponema primitia ZAS-2]|uniref:FMN-binding domain protein n=1 Tax=Treponema primitia (strain ATCC BAA-887 / DSM 12427 / ZAS-2) TaxID=545694 RepID=F5YL85_TREPZ|nr:FMN-binding protein [Treponema primitia]AEF85315.1 FMN-binding domain protein [Treponema primitia ZAS-2]
MKKSTGALGVILVLLAALSGCASRFDKLQPLMPDLQGKADGAYRGSYKAFPVSVILDVEVKDTALTNITIIKHFNGRGSKAEKIIETVLAKQSVEVDTVSGATASSKVILKAIENALE